MKRKIGETEYDIPSVQSVADYRYAKELRCKCSANDSFNYMLKHLDTDGIYESDNGQYICFTCRICEDRIYFHINDFDAYAALGVFDKYIVAGGSDLFEISPNKGVDFPKLNDRYIDGVLSKCSIIENSLYHESLWCKDKQKKDAILKTDKLLGILNHHFNSSRYLYGAMLLEYKKGKGDSDLLFKYKNIVSTEFANICEFIGKAERGDVPQQIKLWDRNGYITYTAVTVGGQAKIKQLLKRSEVKDEMKRVSEIVKNRGAYYYADMLKELKGLGNEFPATTPHYFITD